MNLTVLQKNTGQLEMSTVLGRGDRTLPPAPGLLPSSLLPPGLLPPSLLPPGLLPPSLLSPGL